MKTKYIIFAIILFTSFEFSSGYNKKLNLKAGTKIAEPFVIKDKSGKWSGITIELWENIADSLNAGYSFQEYDLSGLLDAVETGNVDIAVAPLTITASREKNLDFSHPYFISGLGIATRIKESNVLMKVLDRFLSYDFLRIVFFLLLLLFLVGFITWIFERKKNAEQFGDGKTKGLGSSFWWAAVTMTTVGYGDKVPKTAGGRIIGLIWMFAGLIIISSFTAAIASALTVTQLESQIQGLSDLYNACVGTVAASSSIDYLNGKNIRHITYPSVTDAIEALSSNKIDAVVYDSPILKYKIIKLDKTGTLKVLPVTLDPLYYGFALPQNSKVREKLNRVLLNEIVSQRWKKILKNYLGEVE